MNSPLRVIFGVILAIHRDERGGVWPHVRAVTHHVRSGPSPTMESDLASFHGPYNAPTVAHSYRNLEETVSLKSNSVTQPTPR